jgi:hypothetical protein
MSKFGRVYKLSLELAGGQKADIELPITVEFEVRRETLASSQTATIKVYNLGERLRNLIYKDRFNLTEFRAVQLRAGYESIGTPLIFNGTILQAYSERMGGSVDYVTTIECYDGAFAMANSYSSQTFAAGATREQVLRGLNKDLKGVAAEAILGSFPKTYVRGSVYMGNTWTYVVQVSDGLATIDNGQLKVLNQNEVIETEIPLITAESGLLGSPRRSNTMLEFSMLFEPRFSLGQLVALQSQTNSIFNGAYKVMGFTHRATISPAVAGEARTEVSLWKGTAPFTLVRGNAIQ